MLLFLRLILLAKPEIEELKKVFYLRLAAGRGGGGANLREIGVDKIPVHEGIEKVDNVVAALVAACCARIR